MYEALQVIACGVIYFLVVYMLVIRREARPILPWTVCILTQVLSTVFFYDIVEFVEDWFFPPEDFGDLGMIIPSAVLCIVNLAVIFLMFGNVMEKIKEKDIEPARVEVDDDFRIVPLPSVMRDAAEQVEDEKAGGDGVTIAFIEKMIEEGRRDEALKYLKMLAYYGKDDQARAEASKMIAQLSAAEE